MTETCSNSLLLDPTSEGVVILEVMVGLLGLLPSRIRGSSTAYVMSASRLNTTAATPVTTKKAITRFGSMSRKPSMNSRPIPSHSNTDSVITAPPMMALMSNATIVTRGIMALRNAWRTTTVRFVNPLARAVRM